jgi:glucose/arabinose dehydrogenase
MSKQKHDHPNRLRARRAAQFEPVPCAAAHAEHWIGAGVPASARPAAAPTRRRKCVAAGVPAVVGVVVVLSFSVSTPPAPAATPREPGFEVTTFARELAFPVAMDFAPDGRLFVAQKSGTVRVVESGVVAPEPFASIEVHDLLESGLLGLTVDPNFSDNHYVYLFATVSDEEQQIIRFTERDGVGVDRTVIRGHIPTAGTFHNGGCIKFGPDGMLYFSVGDTTRVESAQDMTTLAGKICRITPDGDTPADNPFKTPSGSPRAVYALGFRNPFRFCFAPDGRIFAADVGSDFAVRREEINLVLPAHNYGWPVNEGVAANPERPDLDDPIYAYADKGSAPTGCVYYTADQFPPAYQGDLFHVEYTLNRVYRVVLDGDRVVSHTVFVQGEQSPVDLVTGPDGALYYCELASGEIKRIAYADADHPNPDGAPDPANEGRDLVNLCGSGILVPTMVVAGLTCTISLRRIRRKSFGTA